MSLNQSHNITGQDLDNWYQQAIIDAIANQISNSEVDWLLQAITCLSSLELRLRTFASKSQIKSNKSLSELEQLWQQRLQKRLPVQYLLETVFWRRFQLRVTPSVLIPRPETELMIDIAQEHCRISSIPQHWVDLGTGSGAIALGLAEVFPDALIHGVDLSDAALAIARENAASYQLEGRISFYQGSWWSPLKSYQSMITGMLANPPYIPSGQIQGLQPEVAQHEPRLALDGGTDGLDEIRHLIETAPQYLVADGMWLIELMVGQAESVTELLRQQGEYADIQVLKDLNGIERFVMAFKK
ncbi:MAG: peptide chain release factor N(5)-glutamine methyltransferase [Cyanobacteria bacterium J06621_8]